MQLVNALRLDLQHEILNPPFLALHRKELDIRRLPLLSILNHLLELHSLGHHDVELDLSDGTAYHDAVLARDIVTVQAEDARAVFFPRPVFEFNVFGAQLV